MNIQRITDRSLQMPKQKATASTAYNGQNVAIAPSPLDFSLV